MKFLKINGEIGEISPSTDDFNSYLTENGSRIYFRLPTISEDMQPCDVISLVMSVLSANPPYIPKNDVPWILAYLDALKDFIENNLDDSNIYCRFGNGVVARFILDGHYPYDRDKQDNLGFVSITRKIAAVNILLSHIYGFGSYHCGEAFSDKSKVVGPSSIKFTPMSMIENMEVKQVRYLYRTCIDFVHEKMFKREMTSDIYKGSFGVFRVPDDYKVVFDGSSPHQEFSPGSWSFFEVDKFFLSSGGTVYRGMYGTPSYIQNPQEEASRFIPNLLCSIGKSNHFSQGLMIDLPFSWVTHLVDADCHFNSPDMVIIEVPTHDLNRPTNHGMDELIRAQILGGKYRQS